MSAQIVYPNAKGVKEVNNNFYSIAVPFKGKDNQQVTGTDGKPVWQSALVNASNVGPSIQDGQTKKGEPIYRTAIALDEAVHWKLGNNAPESLTLPNDGWENIDRAKFAIDYAYGNAGKINKDAEYNAIIEDGKGLSKPTADAGYSRVKPFEGNVVATDKDGNTFDLNSGVAWSANADAAAKKLVKEPRFASRLARNMPNEGMADMDEKAVISAKRDFVKNFTIEAKDVHPVGLEKEAGAVKTAEPVAKEIATEMTRESVSTAEPVAEESGFDDAEPEY